MAENSQREQILEYWKNKFEAGDTSRTAYFKTVQRKRIGLEEFEEYSGEMLPVLAIIGKLPVPVEKKSGRRPGDADMFYSKLSTDFIVYALENENPDSLISNIADDLWVVLYSDQTSGEKPNWLTSDLVVSPEPIIGHWPPYINFKMVVDFYYYHTTGGI